MRPYKYQGESFVLIFNIKNIENCSQGQDTQTHGNGEQNEDNGMEASQAAPTQPCPGSGPQLGED